MNILVLNYEYPPLGSGGGAVCKELAEGLAKRGHSLTVVTMAYPGLPEEETVGGVRIRRIPCIRKHRKSCSMPETMSYAVSAGRVIRKELDLKKFDVCHVHFILPSGLAAYPLWKRSGLPYILTAHGSDVEGYNIKPGLKTVHHMIRPMTGKIIRNAYAAAVPSKTLMDLMRETQKKGRFVLIRNGIDLPYGKTPPKKKKKILIGGRLQKIKNVETVLQALGMVSLDGWEADVLGDGPEKVRLEALAKTLPDGGRIRFHGWVGSDTEEYTALMKEAAVYISASRVENCPVMVLEAACAGCRLLLSDIEGHREMMRDQAEYFAPDSPEELAEKLRAVLSGALQPAVYDLEQYNAETTLLQYEQLLKKAAASRKK